MTGGTVVVLGEVGRNAAAGMSGGELYVLDETGFLERRVGSAVEVRPLSVPECDRVRAIVDLHANSTRSLRAADILVRWDQLAGCLRRLVPREQAAELEEVSDASP